MHQEHSESEVSSAGSKRWWRSLMNRVYECISSAGDSRFLTLEVRPLPPVPGSVPKSELFRKFLESVSGIKLCMMASVGPDERWVRIYILASSSVWGWLKLDMEPQDRWVTTFWLESLAASHSLLSILSQIEVTVSSEYQDTCGWHVGPKDASSLKVSTSHS